GYGWRVAAHLPLAGGSASAVRTVAWAVDELARLVLPELLALADASTLAALSPRDGRFDLATLRDVAARVAAAQAATRRVSDRLAAARTARLVGPVRSAVDRLGTGVDRLLALLGSADRVMRLAPALLGADGPRTFLVVFQNPAEIRSTGGIPGAFVAVQATDGAVRIVDQGTAAADLGAFPSPVLPLDPAMASLYTAKLGTYPADTNLTPYFPVTAALLREMYRRRTGTTVDGVLSVDPVALAYLLRATGPIRLPSGSVLDSASAVRVLLSDAYARLAGTGESDVREKDEFFATAARQVFQDVMGGHADPGTALTALAAAAGERRLLLWSARPAEEHLIAGTTLEGALPLRDGAFPTVGVFLNDGSGAKLDYYLHAAARLTAGDCTGDGRRVLHLHLVLESRVPRTGLPAYVLGLGLAGDPYTARTQVLVFSPVAGGVSTVLVDGVATAVGAGRERGRGVAVLTVDLAPGQRRAVDVTLVTAVLPGSSGQRAVQPRMWVTPGVNPWTITTAATAACGPRD
ncbi:MAG TPA: DUF4012 domain-containing protein, partial [Rugosimonospora sp.]|nr:DUF4012 domain-containing protein [Rugosimonospora sp.]